MGTVTVKRRIRAFILLEVLVAMVIIGISMVGLMRGFVASLDTIKRVQLNETAILVAKTLMDDMILEPPAEGKYELKLADDPRFGERYEAWTVELEVEADEPDYKERPPGKMLQELEEIYFVERLSIFHEDRFAKREILRLQTFLIEPDLFSPQSLQANQLF